MAAAKPKPPPLDTDEAAAAATSDLPAAESGKATADDAAAAAAAERAKLAASQPPASATDEPRGPTGPVGPPGPGGATGPVSKGDEPAKAVLVDSAGVLYARPDPSAPISLTEAVVNGNWFGQYKGKPAHVKHGTPIGALPPTLAQAIRETRNVVVGVLPPKLPPNPFAP